MEATPDRTSYDQNDVADLTGAAVGETNLDIAKHGTTIGFFIFVFLFLALLGFLKVRKKRKGANLG